MEATDTAVERRIRESPSSRLYRANMRPANVAVHLLRVPKAVLTGPIVPGHSFAAEFKALFAILAMRRKGSRITILSDVAEADMVRCSIRKAYPPVDHHLGQMDRLGAAQSATARQGRNVPRDGEWGHAGETAAIRWSPSAGAAQRCSTAWSPRQFNGSRSQALGC